MSKWGVRPEFKESELRKAVDIVARELIRHLQHGLCDPDLSNFVTKSTRALTRIGKARRNRLLQGGNNGKGKAKEGQAQGSRVSLLSPKLRKRKESRSDVSPGRSDQTAGDTVKQG